MNKIILGMFWLLALLLVMAPIQSKAANASVQSVNPVTHGKTWAQLTTVEKTVMVSAMVACVAFIVAEIWFIVAGFQASVPWGLFMLFIGGMRSLFVVIGFVAWVVNWLVMTRSLDMLHAMKLPMAIALVYVGLGGVGIMIFIFKHWQHARKPLAVFILAILALMSAVGLSFVK